MANVAEAFVTMRPDMSTFGGNLKSKLGGLAGLAGKAALGIGAAVGAAVVKGTFDAINQNQVSDRMAAQLGLDPAEQEKFGRIAGDLYANAYGESLEQVHTAVGNVASTIADDLDGAGIERVTQKALDLANAFEQDVGESVAIAGVLMETGLAEDADHAFDLITAGLQEIPAALRDELGEATTEYSKFFADLGFTGEETFAMFAAADDKFALDKTGDAIKELSIRATDMSKTSVEAFEAAGLDAEEMAGKILAGGDTARDGFDTIISGLLAIEDPTARANAAIGLFGTPLEDLGTAQIPDFLESLQDMGGGLGDVEGRAAEMGDTLNDNLGTRLETLKRQGLMALADLANQYVLPALDGLLDAFEIVASILRDPDITSDGWIGVVERIIVGFITFKDTVSQVIAFVTGIFKSNSGDMESTAATTWASISEIFQSAADAIIAIVSWFVGIATEFWERFGTHIIQYMKGTWENIKQLIDAALRVIKGIFDVFAGVFTGDWSRVWEGVKAIFSGVWSAIHAILSQGIEAIKLVLGAAVAAISQIWESIWNTVKTLARNAWDAIVGVVRDKINQTKDEIRAIKDFVVGFFSGAGTWLKNAGRAILDGLFDGLKEKWSELRDWVGGLGDKIKNLKGPLPEDKRLLKDEGQAIIEGLGAGMEDEWGAIERFLGTRTAEIPLNVAGPSLDVASRQTLRPIDLTLDLGEGVSRRIRIEQDRHDGDVLVGLRKGPR